MADTPTQAPIDWAAIIAGAVLATSIGLILLTFGAALGLSVTSPYEGEGLDPAWYVIGTGLWMLWVQLLAFTVGGYAAARLRKPQTGITEHEIEVRDGFHGLLVWGVGVIAAAIITTAAVGNITAAAEQARFDSSLASSVAQATQAEIDQAAGRERATNPDADDESLAEARAEIARKLAIIAAFITAASLLVGAAAAYYAAESGGRHRDKGRHVRFYALTAAEARDAAKAMSTPPPPR